MQCKKKKIKKIKHNRNQQKQKKKRITVYNSGVLNHIRIFQTKITKALEGAFKGLARHSEIHTYSLSKKMRI